MRVLTIVNQEDAGPGVFADAAAAAGHELVEWVPSAGPSPGVDGHGAAMVFGGAMNVDEEDAHPWLGGEKRLIGELVAGGHAGARGLPRRSAALRGGRRRAGPRVAARDRLARRRADAAGARRSRDRRAAAALRGLPVAQLRGGAARGVARPGAQPRLRPGVPRRRARLGDPVPRRGRRGDRRRPGSTTTTRTPTRSGSGIDPAELLRRDAGQDRALERARAGAVRALPRAARAAATPA